MMIWGVGGGGGLFVFCIFSYLIWKQNKTRFTQTAQWKYLV